MGVDLMRSDYFTPYSTIEKAVLQIVGQIYPSGAAGTPSGLRDLTQIFINQAIYYINSSFTIKNLKNIRQQSSTNLILNDYDLDLINECGLEYYSQINTIYLKKVSDSTTKPPMKYVTGDVFLAKYMPIVDDSSGTPTVWSIFDSRYLFFYPKTDEEMIVTILYDKYPPAFSGYTGYSPFTNDYDQCIIAMASGLFYLSTEEIEIGGAWIEVANAMLNKKTLSFSHPSNFSPSHQPSIQKGKVWTDPNADEDA
jgi:hypothetical protein